MSSVEDAVTAASKISGFIQPHELYWLATQASFRNRILEYGSWKGKSTKAIAMTCPGTVYAVDHWLGSDNERQTNHVEAVSLGSDGLLKVFKTNMENEIKTRKVIPVRAECLEAAEIMRFVFSYYSFDMIFIDGNHQYEIVKKDIQAWLPFVCSGGIICGHDYYDAPDVKRAVTELFPNHVEGPIWSYIVP